MEDVVWFNQVDRHDIKLVGGKGANLGELLKTNAPVPNGFIVTATAYERSIKTSGALDRIKGILFNLNADDPAQLEEKARACQAEILKIELDDSLTKTIKKYYRVLSDQKNPYVAVRSSATAEDLPEASFAGQQATFLNVRGEEKVIGAILQCWASLFEARAIFYRVKQNFDHTKVSIAVPVQLMVNSEVSGVMFTADPVSSDKNTIVIEAIYGLGELIVGGQVTPDHYEVDKQKYQLKSKTIVNQTKQLVKTKGRDKITYVSRAYQKKQKLADEKITELAHLGEAIERHYFFPQDIEWAYEDGKIYIVQTRPVTTLDQGSRIESLKTVQLPIVKYQLLLQGAPASPAIGTGPVVVIKSAKELSKVKKGDVLVTKMTTPDFVPAMKRAVAIVTDLGGRTSHAAIVSREMGIACVVGTGGATKKLQDGMIVTVDGSRGYVYKGRVARAKGAMPKVTVAKSHLKTATHLYVNLAEPELAREIAAKNVDGVGLLRAEFILAQIGSHPKKFIKEGREKEFIDELAKNLEVFARSFGRRPVIYRATDLKTSEYRNLAGGDMYEPREPNPMLGYRGAYRFIRDPDVFKLELAAVKAVRAKHKNLHIMIPYVRSVPELENVKTLVDASGLLADHDFQFWMMAEIPVNVITLADFIKVGIDGVSIGSNDLTMLILGTDRDNEEVATEFDELSPAVLWALEKIIKTCAKYNITSSICGQAPSIYPELTEKLVSWGITSISVNPDAIDSTRELIYRIEHKIVQKHG